MEKLRGLILRNWGLIVLPFLTLESRQQWGRAGMVSRRGQSCAVGQDLGVPVGQDEQQGNSWKEQGWESPGAGVGGRGRLPGKDPFGGSPLLSRRDFPGG